MIILFHVVFNVWLSILKQYKTFFAKSSSTSDHKDAEDNLFFDPPVYKQRYGAVHNILLDNPWRNSIHKIVDFGCAEFQLFPFLKWFPRIREIMEVDIDYNLLKDHLYRIHPLTSDYLGRRLEPLSIHVLQGSICEPDNRLLGTDVVIGIELIEHLFPNDLDSLPYNVFHFINPKIAIFTTPNEDFNVLFPNFTGFRHADHKFEWTREQFESWATNLVTRFPDYTVTFEGIGEGPPGTEHLGCCSQMAVFIKNSAIKEIHNESETISEGVCTYNSSSNAFYVSSGSNGSYYTLIETIEYPYEKDDRTVEQKILDELKYGLQLRSNINGRFYNETLDRFEVPISELLYGFKAQICTQLEAREILENAHYKIEECTLFDELEACVVYEPEMEDSRSSTPLSSSDSTDPRLEDVGSDWNISEDSTWETSTNNQNVWLNETQINDTSTTVHGIVDTLVNTIKLPEEQPKFSNGITLFMTNDAQRISPERKLKNNLKSQTLDNFWEAGPSYAKKKKKKLHDDDNDSLLDVFKNDEIECKYNERHNGEIAVNTLNEPSSHDFLNIDDEECDREVELASCEALFDPSSVIILPVMDELTNNNTESSVNFDLIGMNEDQQDAPILPLNADPFPNWLLNMLGAEVVIDEITHDEPHFYCQGDGLGVHPSFIEGDFEDEHSTSDSSNSSNETATLSNDAAEAEPSESEVEVLSLPYDSSSEAVALPVPTTTGSILSDSSVETSNTFYDTTEESTSANSSTKT